MDVWYNGKYAVSFYEYGTELEPIGRFLGHTWKTWGLVPEARPFFPPPQRKKTELDANGINGKIDISKSLIGIPLYENREASWKFYVTDFFDRTTNIRDSDDADVSDNVGDPIKASILQTFSEKYTQLLTVLNGREVAVVLDEDPDYFYKGFVDVETWESPNDDSLNGITLRCDVFPYKIKKEPTVLTIKDSAMDRFGTEIEFDSGNMPLVPYIKVEYNVSATSVNLNTGYSNSEVGIFQDYQTNGLSINLKRASTSGLYEGLRKLTAAWRGGNPVSSPSFLCSNYVGDNRCMIIVQRPALPDNFNSVLLVFRKGSM